MKAIILRGLPGSGKSEFAKFLCGAEDTVKCSADDHFVGPDGVYRFDHRQLLEAHTKCFRLFTQICSEGKHNVVVDNTNTIEADFRRYEEFAKASEYSVTIIRIETTLTDEELAQRNVHKVPIETIKRMRTKLYGK